MQSPQPMNVQEIRNKLMANGLKVTPQRIAVLEAVIKLQNHPTAEQIIAHIRQYHPNIATATVYKVLESLTAIGLIKRVKTDKDIMRYDAILEKHHHLYCSETDRIEDFTDENLNHLIENYFAQKKIPDFQIQDIKLQIIGKFIK